MKKLLEQLLIETPKTILVIGVICFALAVPVAAGPVVLASIKPLALLAEAVAGERGQVVGLLNRTVSPHDYTLRVSALRELERADLVLWVGPELERFLVKPLANSVGKPQIQTSQLPGIVWPQQSQGHSNHHHDPAGEHGRDPHLWLNPLNGAVIARALAQQLSVLDPAGAQYYRLRGDRLVAEIEALDGELRHLLAPVRSRGFAVYHQGYDHWVSHYGLRQLAAVTVTPEVRPGARHLYRLRQTLQGRARCLFSEPYYPSVARDLAEELGLATASLDPLGTAVGARSYPDLLRQMGQAMVSCLAAD